MLLPTHAQFKRIQVIFAVLWFVAIPCRAQSATSANDAAVQKTLKILIGAIRYKKDDLALKQLALPEMSQVLMGESWSTMQTSEKDAFLGDLATLLKGMCFPRGRDIFQYLDAVFYAPATFSEHEAHCKSTVVVHRELKKTEIVIDWVLHQQAGGAWRVVDTKMLGESTAEGIREDQVLPLLKEGGVAKVLEAMRTQAHNVETKGQRG